MHLSRIFVFPIKSLDGLEVEAASITPGGILENDRVYAMFDAEGHVVNGKRTAQVHRLRAQFDPPAREVCLGDAADGAPRRFALEERGPIERWLSDFFGFAVTLKHDPIHGFPDDPQAFGPTVVSRASLSRVCEWYEGWTIDGARRRFRSNLELDGGDAFCEDRLFGAPEELRPFRIGPVAFAGHNPCQRCVVPTRDPDTGDVVRGFQKSFADLRKETLPVWVDARRFNHFYRFAVNTSIPASESGKRLRVGDAVAG
jgi:uncharacterized protein YcbX